MQPFVVLGLIALFGCCLSFSELVKLKTPARMEISLPKNETNSRNKPQLSSTSFSSHFPGVKATGNEKHNVSVTRITGSKSTTKFTKIKGKSRLVLRKERKKLRNMLKNSNVKRNSSNRHTILKKLKRVNQELKKLRPRNSKQKRNNSKGKNKHNIATKMKIAPRNKYPFKWVLNDKQLNKNTSSRNTAKFHLQRDGTEVTSNDILEQEALEKSYSQKNSSDNVRGVRAREILSTTTVLNTTTPLPHTQDDSGKVDPITPSVSRINYSTLMKLESTTIPPVKNVSLKTILDEFNAITYQMGAISPFSRKYAKMDVHDDVVKKKTYRTRCGVRNGGCEHRCYPRGRRMCSCMPGFRLSFNRKSCADVDECTYKTHDCTHLCRNTPGSYYCACPEGLRLADDKKSCEDVDECLLRNGHGPCQDTCVNEQGSYRCSCSNLPGTRLGVDGHQCEDIDECLEGRSGCSHGCVNTLGRVFCTCPGGMELGHDWKTCHDINECDHNDVQDACSFGCVNTMGSYYCLESNDVQSDQPPSPLPDVVACPPLFPPKLGYLECSRKQGVGVTMRSKSGRLRVTNRPGMSCRLVCPHGYVMRGTYELVCGYGGEWLGDKSGDCVSKFGKEFR